MDNNILNTLESIRQQTSSLSRVAFVFHCWMPFNNLCTDGYRIPAIQSDKIPRLTLLPIVALNVPLFDSIRNPNTNKFVPVVQQHRRPIEASYSIITQRYGKFGFIMIPELDTDLEKAETYLQYFSAIMRPFYAQGGKMQDLPEYFGAQSPIEEIFDKVGGRLTTTARNELDNMFRAGTISEADYHKFLASMNSFARSAITAHRIALAPGYGILQESITAINEKHKARLDAVDEFLIREFPGFDSASQLNRRSAQDSTKELTDVFREFLQTQAGKSPVAQVQETIPAVPVTEAAFSEPLKEDEIETSTLDEVIGIKCMATTGAGNPCSLTARPGFKSCINIAHQKQTGEFADEANA
jgi:hypothetical protein